MSSHSISKEFEPNPDILRKCREQMGYSIDDVKKKIKVKSIELIEAGKKRPTYKQLEDLGKLYDVPDWVFISKELPPEYRYDEKPNFRKFKNSEVFVSGTRKLFNQAKDYRDFFLELREDIELPITPFSLGQDMTSEKIKKMSPKGASIWARNWLSLKDTDRLNFDQLREKLEEKSIFVFLSNKFRGAGNIKGINFRGTCLTHEVMPIIIINDSDARKAQSFTLFHELGHLLRNDDAIDSFEESNSTIELWCEDFSGNFLMPENEFMKMIKEWKEKIDFEKDLKLKIVKDIADYFQVSTHSCLVRMRRLEVISKEKYDTLNAERENQNENYSGFAPRKRHNEVKKRFGLPFIRTVFDAWHQKELNLVQVLRVFDLKKVSHVRKIEGELKP